MKKYHSTRHHRRPRSKLGQDIERNISLVPQNHHEAWHTLFFNADPEEIAQIINRIWLDPDYEFLCRKK